MANSAECYRFIFAERAAKALPKNVAILLVFQYSLVMINTMGLLCSSNITTVSYNVTIFDSLLFSCKGTTEKGDFWKKDEELMNIGQYLIYGGTEEKFVLFENFSLFINSVLILHQGIYECGSNASSLMIYSLNVNGSYYQEFCTYV